ncbi:homeobox protein 5 [Anastrepha ludens]|uniref:homeobox protein 5 n=1 Tax=Anastrepha ludens TaxID=28586 RepID=UPI0023AFC2A8|nr:homeobox protein 5 [Anastrepha ludens]
MQISCKCLNFIATTNSQAANNNVGIISVNSNNGTATADAHANRNPSAGNNATTAHPDEDSSMPLAQQSIAGSNNAGNGNNNANNLCTTLMEAFLQRFPRTFIFYSQCMEFFKQAIGPITDLNIHTLSQRDLVYSITLEVPTGQEHPLTHSWQLSICINCNAALCAKRLPTPILSTTTSGIPAPLTINPPQFLINCSLLMNNDELALRRASKSFSDTFGLLIMDHPQLQLDQANTGPLSNFSIGSLSTTTPSFQLDIKQQRLRQLQQNLQQRLKREIAETDERIQRYTEQQFALLKSFRDKSEQEYVLLGRLIQRVPEQQAIEFLDRLPPSLEVIGGGSYVTRRRNTISSRLDMTSITTPSTPSTPNPVMSGLHMLSLPLATTASTTASAMDTTNTQGTAASTALTPTTTTSVLATTIVGSNSVNRRVSNFDTPPATPEATPMSVGNSPTFRPQQQQQQQPLSLSQQQFVRIAANSFQQQFPTPTVEVADDCLFELEGIDSGGSTNVPVSTPYGALVSNLSQKLPYQQQQRPLNNHSHPHYHQHHHSHGRDMSDVDESEDDAGEAEVALDLDNIVPIPMGTRPVIGGQQRPSTATAADVMNFAKSLPIEIANSPMTAGRSYVNVLEEDELDNTVDIAASIKALAKSVHGEAVFGDLPRPRLRSQI